MGYDNRRDDRYQVAVAASYRNGTGAAEARPIRVTNISARGCRFAGDTRLGMGALISLAIGRSETIDAKVRWRVGRTHGVRFNEALPPAVLDHIRLFLSEQPAYVAEREPLAA